MASFDQPGNALPAPGYTTGTHSVDDELLAAYNPPPLQKGITLKPGQGVLLLGTLLEYEVASKKYIKTTQATVANAKGFLRQTTDTGTTADAQNFLGNIVQAGVLRLSKVSAANSGVTLPGLLGGRVDTIAGYFIF